MTGRFEARFVLSLSLTGVLVVSAAVDRTPPPAPRFQAAQQVDNRVVDLGLLYDGQTHTAGLGVTSVESRLEVTSETLFQVGFTNSTPGPGGHPNEPSGMTQLADNPFTGVLAPSGWTEYRNSTVGHPNGQEMTVEIDATGPTSLSSVYSRNLTTGEDGGGQSAGLSLGSTRRSTMYAHFSVKPSTNYQGHNSTTNKLGFFWSAKTGGGSYAGSPLFFLMSGRDNNALRLAVEQQGGAAPGFANFKCDTPSNEVGNTCSQAELPRNSWSDIEILVVANNPLSSANGSIEAWVNGVQVLKFSSVQIFKSNHIDGKFKFKFEFIWGGTGDLIASDMEVSFDHAYVSGRN